MAQKHANKTTDEALRQRLTAARSGWDTKAPAPTADDIAYARVIAHDPCSYCGGPGGVIDHVTYNEHGWENLTASCRRCNVAKGQQSMLRFVYARQLRADRDEITDRIRRLGDPHRRRKWTNKPAETQTDAQTPVEVTVEAPISRAEAFRRATQRHYKPRG